MTVTNTILIVIIIVLAAYCGWLRLHVNASEEELSQQKKVKLHISNNDIMHYIKETAGNFKPLMESKGIDFSIKCTPESMMGWMDTDKVDKILLLLLSDPSQFASDNGKVTLEAYTNDSYDQVIIHINDNGQKRSDMGAIIAHNLTHLLHGTVRSDYYEEQGNSIVLELPIKKDAFQTDIEQGVQTLPSDFHIPQNIELNVPTIELPKGVEGAPSPIGAIIQQAYVSADQKYLQKAVQCIHDHITDSDYSRDDFARDMGCSVSTLYNKIRQLTGKNVTNFVRDIRIKTACRLAKENPDLRVSDIAYQVGFKDPKYFATSFKRVMGIQPKEYITQLKSGDR
ncbi:MAG: helix-turn-helix domain-containing protein [Prevotella sp.]|nr:helix-turn-helix domain-containing protein [Prevotella sp.]